MGLDGVSLRSDGHALRVCGHASMVLRSGLRVLGGGSRRAVLALLLVLPFFFVLRKLLAGHHHDDDSIGKGKGKGRTTQGFTSALFRLSDVQPRKIPYVDLYDTPTSRFVKRDQIMWTLKPTPKFWERDTDATATRLGCTYEKCVNIDRIRPWHPNLYHSLVIDLGSVLTKVHTREDMERAGSTGALMLDGFAVVFADGFPEFAYDAVFDAAGVRERVYWNTWERRKCALTCREKFVDVVFDGTNGMPYDASMQGRFGESIRIAEVAFMSLKEASRQLAWVRNIVQNAISNAHIDKEEKEEEARGRGDIIAAAKCKLLYLERDARRRAVNYDDVLKTVTRATICDVTSRLLDASMPFNEQMRLIRSADIIVGVHGMAFAWTAFLREETVVVEIAPYGWLDAAYRNMAKSAGAFHIVVQADDMSLVADVNEHRNSDFTVPLDDLDRVVAAANFLVANAHRRFGGACPEVKSKEDIQKHLGPDGVPGCNMLFRHKDDGNPLYVSSPNNSRQRISRMIEVVVARYVRSLEKEIQACADFGGKEVPFAAITSALGASNLWATLSPLRNSMRLSTPHARLYAVVGSAADASEVRSHGICALTLDVNIPGLSEDSSVQRIVFTQVLVAAAKMFEGKVKWLLAVFDASNVIVQADVTKLLPPGATDVVVGAHVRQEATEASLAKLPGNNTKREILHVFQRPETIGEDRQEAGGGQHANFANALESAYGTYRVRNALDENAIVADAVLGTPRAIQILASDLSLEYRRTSVTVARLWEAIMSGVVRKLSLLSWTVSIFKHKSPSSKVGAVVQADSKKWIAVDVVDANRPSSSSSSTCTMPVALVEATSREGGCVLIGAASVVENLGERIEREADRCPFM